MTQRRSGAATLLLLALLVWCTTRSWLIGHTESINRDGVIYIQMAREWPVDPLHVVHSYDYHVGYPAAISATHRLLGLVDSPRGWELAGQTVSFVASIGVFAAIWFHAQRIFSARVAFLSILFLAASRKWSVIGADVMSDSLGLCFGLWAAGLAYLTLDKLRSGGRLVFLLALLTGVCAGTGYLVRPEELLPAVVAPLIWIASRRRERKPYAPAVAAAVCAMAAAALCVLPYAAAIGRFTQKKSVHQFVDIPAAQTIAPALARATPDATLLQQLGRYTTEALHPLAATFLAVWLLIRIAEVVFRRHLMPARLRYPRWEAVVMVSAVATIVLPALSALYLNVHVFTHRHFLFLAALAVPLAGAGMLVLATWLREGLILAGLPRVRHESLAFVLAAASFVPLLAYSLREPLHAGWGWCRTAGEMAASVMRRGDQLYAVNGLIVHYAWHGGRWDGDWFDCHRPTVTSPFQTKANIFVVRQADLPQLEKEAQRLDRLIIRCASFAAPGEGGDGYILRIRSRRPATRPTTRVTSQPTVNGGSR